MRATYFKHTSLPKTRNEFLLETLYAGVFSGSALALLFLLVDTMDGRPLYTPSLLGSVIFLGIDAEDVKVRFDAVAYFSILHIVAFIALSGMVSFVTHELELHSRHPALFLLLFFAIIEAGFFVVAPIAVPGAIESLGTVRIGVANLMAATAMTAFFLVTHHAKTRGFFKHNFADFLFDSFYSAAIGGSAVALFFFVVDIVDGHPFFTPALIGHMLFLGDSALTLANPEMRDAVVYIVPLHFVWSLAMGIIATWLIHSVELRSRHPIEVLLVLFVIIEVSFLLVVPLAMPGLIERLGIVRMLIGNLVAAASMSVFFVWSHAVEPGVSLEPDESGATQSDTIRS